VSHRNFERILHFRVGPGSMSVSVSVTQRCLLFFAKKNKKSNQHCLAHRLLQDKKNARSTSCCCNEGPHIFFFGIVNKKLNRQINLKKSRKKLSCVYLTQKLETSHIKPLRKSKSNRHTKNSQKRTKMEHTPGHSHLQSPALI